MRILVLMIAGLGLASTAAAQTQTPTTAPAKTSKHVSDPNRLICETQDDLGTRLSSHRVCHTASQWAEQRRADREDIDQRQMQRGCNNNTGC